MVPMKWIPAIRNFLATLHAELELSVDFVPKVQRENDCFLMDIATNGTFKPRAIWLVNACRLFLGVTLLSDIVNAAGISIRTEI